MNTLIERIEKAHYVVNLEQVEALAAQQHTNADLAARTGATYLRALIATSLANLKKVRKPAATTVLAAVNKTHGELYPAVLRGVDTLELKTVEETEHNKELNRRGNFARSAASTVRAYVKAGGDLRSLDLAATSKGDLYRATQPPESADKIERNVVRSEAKLIRALRQEAGTNLEWAQEHATLLIEELQQLLKEFAKAPARVVKHTLRRHAAPAHARLS